MDKLFILTIGLALLLSLQTAFPGNKALADQAVWSKQAYAVPRGRDFRVPSPDRKRNVLVKESMLIVMEGGSPVSGIEGYTLYLPAEIAWAPDSKAFVVSSNEGGADDIWFATVFLFEYDRVTARDVTAEAAEKFKALLQCPEAGEPNIGAVKWTRESKNLVVVAEVPATASCPGRDAVRGYVVEVPSGKVLSELEPKKLVDAWGEYLGPRVTRRLPR